MTTFIYALCDPDTDMVRHVGKTTNPKKRLRRHLQDNDNTYKSRWINKLKSQGKSPRFQILEETDESQKVENAGQKKAMEKAVNLVKKLEKKYPKQIEAVYVV